MLQLRECHSYERSGAANKEPQVGEIVLLRSDSKLRGLWKLARVKQTLRGKDGQVRGVVLQIPSRESGSNVLRRPLQYLYPLELNCNVNNADGPESAEISPDKSGTGTDETAKTESSPATQQVRTLENRPKRAAAQKANDFIRAVITDTTD